MSNINLKKTDLRDICERVIAQAERERLETIKTDLNNECSKYNFWRSLFGFSRVTEREFFNDYKELHRLYYKHFDIEHEAKLIIFYIDNHIETKEPEYIFLDFNSYVNLKTYIGEGISSPNL